MNLHRREFLCGVSVSALWAADSQPQIRKPRIGAATIRAVAFDAFPVLDPRPVFSLVSELFPAKGVALSSLWRTKQFEYTWLRTLEGRYRDFRQVTSDALISSARALEVDLTPDTHDRLMGAYLQLRCWPDVPAALTSLRRAGFRIAFLSNMTPAMLKAGMGNSGLNDAFDYVLSTDAVRAYKPHPRAYRMAVDAFGLKPNQILFAAFAAWDAAGAKSFGYPTFWVNRLGQPAEELGAAPDGRGESMGDLVKFLDL